MSTRQKRKYYKQRNEAGINMVKDYRLPAEGTKNYFTKQSRR